MRTALIIAGLLVSLVAQPQEIYRWVDKDGIVHFADQPGSPDATIVSQQRFREPSPDAAPPDLYESDRRDSRDEPAVGPTYESLRITSPAEDEVFYGGDVSVFVQLELDRSLRPGDQVEVTLDGRPQPIDGMTTTLTGMPRGSHVLQAMVKDDTGGLVISSPQVTFHLRQQTVATPPTGPAVAPRPLPPGSRPPGAPQRPTPLPGRS